MREADSLYEKAAAAAWSEAEKRLGEIAAAAQGTKPEIVNVYYDRTPGESTIEELPDLPISSRPEAVEVVVRLRVEYALR